MIGETIKSLREKKGLKLNELARKAGVNASYLSAIENNKKQNPSRAILKKVADQLDMTVDDIIRISAAINSDYYARKINEGLMKPDDMIDIEMTKRIEIKNRYKKSINTLIDCINSNDESDYIFLLNVIRNTVDYINSKSINDKSIPINAKEGDTK